ncbi:hypothetical protein SLA2020_352630 [Shorea laevis]
MLNLKHCKMEESSCDDEDEECAYKLKPKRQKTNEYHCSYSGVEDLSSGSDYWSNERRHWAAELNSNLKQKSESQSSKGLKRHKPPLLKSLRGRTHMLPSRFNDTVLDEWRNKKFAVKDLGSGFNDDEFVEERVRSRKFDEIVYLERKFECGSSEFDPVCKREKEDDAGLVDVSSFDYKRYFDCYSWVECDGH